MKSALGSAVRKEPRMFLFLKNPGDTAGNLTSCWVRKKAHLRSDLVQRTVDQVLSINSP